MNDARMSCDLVLDEKTGTFSNDLHKKDKDKKVTKLGTKANLLQNISVPGTKSKCFLNKPPQRYTTKCLLHN